MPGIDSLVTALAFHPTESYVFAGTSSGDVLCLKSPSGKVKKSLSRKSVHRTSVRDVAISTGDHTLVASVSTSGVCVTSIMKVKDEPRWLDHPEPGSLSKVSPTRVCWTDKTGKHLVVGYSDGSLSLFDTKTGSKVHSIREQQDDIVSLEYTEGSSRILAVSSDATIAHYDLRTSKQQLKLNALSDPQDHELLCGTGFSQIERVGETRKKWILTGDTEGWVGVWKGDNIGDIRDRFEASSQGTAVSFLCQIPNTNQAVIALSDGSITVWNLFSHKKAFTVAKGKQDAELACASFDARTDRVAVAFDLESGVEIFSIEAKKADHDSSKANGSFFDSL